MLRGRSHNAGMAIRPRKQPTQQRLAEYETLKQSSGWYMAAWRDFRGLTLQDLADEVNTSRGNLHDLETGRERSGGKPPARYNRVWADAIAAVLATTPGHLIDVNPYKADTNALDLFGVPEDQRVVVIQIVEGLKKAKTE